MAVGLWLGANLGSSHQHHYPGTDCATDEDDCRANEWGEYNGIPPFFGIENPPEPDRNPSRKEWREEQDLRAQWEVARWADWIVWLGIFGLATTSIGVVYVALTLREAKNTTKVTREIGEIGNAAYLGINWARVRVVPGGHQLQIAIKNSGNSPARKVKIVASNMWYWPPKGVGSEPSRWPIEFQNPSSIGGGMAHLAQFFIEADEGARQFTDWNSPRRFAVGFKIQWSDVFRNEHALWVHLDQADISARPAGQFFGKLQVAKANWQMQRHNGENIEGQP